MRINTRNIFAAAILSVGLLTISPDKALAQPDGMLFPVIGNVNYTDTFLAYRAGQVDNKHHAIDIFAPKHSKIVSPVDGTVRYVGYPQDSWGWYIVIVDDDGYEYGFMHINNDTPGTDDGRGGPMYAYGPDLFGQYNYGFQNASRVAKGQLLGYVGDSGNAENTPPHLHFEIIKPEYTNYPSYQDVPLEGFVNPFPYLNSAEHIYTPVAYPQLKEEILPYGPNVYVETNIARGNLDEDPEMEVVSGAGPGGGPHISVFNQDKTFTGRQFFAYASTFNGGVDVAVGDIDGDGKNEIITGAGRGGGPHVMAFDQSGNIVASFYAYNPYFEGGIRVSAGDVNGDGIDEIITGAGPGGGPHVRALDKDGNPVGEFFAYADTFAGGVDVAASDVNGDGIDEIITGAGPGGGPHVRALDKDGNPVGEFFAYADTFYGGVKVSGGEAAEKNEGEEVVVAPWTGGSPHIRVLDRRGNSLRETMYIEPWWNGSYDVAAGDGGVNAATGKNRRSSMRIAF